MAGHDNVHLVVGGEAGVNINVFRAVRARRGALALASVTGPRDLVCATVRSIYYTNFLFK